MRASRIAVIVAPCLLLAACSSAGPGASAPVVDKSAPAPGAPARTVPTAPNPLGGIGSTVATMGKVHGSVLTPTGPCATPDTCFGTSVTAPGAPSPSFTAVSLVNGLVGGYQQNFPTGSTVDQAITQVMRLLPPDSRASSFATISGAMTSCAFFNVASPTLAALFPGNQTQDPYGPSTGAVVGVELSSTTAQGFTVYEPADVQRAQLKLGADDSSMAC